MNCAWVGLGSNLDDPAAHIKTAMEQLGRLPTTRCLRVSRLYHSAPVGPQDQPDFCNAVAELHTALAPLPLLSALLQIEQKHKRTRHRRWGPRSLDLDLLLYENLMMNTATLQLPHPRMHERAFVLRPLAELEPGLEIPGQGPAGELLANVGGQAVSLWNSR